MIRWRLLRGRWTHLLVTGVLLLLLAPSGRPRPLTEVLEVARIAIASGNAPAALAALEWALEFEPSLVGLHLKAAEAAILSGDAGAAERHLHMAEAAGLKSTELDCLRARTTIIAGEPRPALEVLRDRRPCPHAATLLSGIADSAITEGDLELAVSALEAQRLLEPGNADIHRQLGYLFAVSQPASAVSPLRIAAQLQPTQAGPAMALVHAIEDAQLLGGDSFVLARVGQTLARHGDWGLAEMAFRRALELDPDYLEARAYHGLALDQVGGDGLEDLQMAVRQAPHAALPRAFLGLHWQTRGSTEEAVASLETAVRLDPENPAITVQLASAYADAGRLGDAKSAYLHGTELAPEETQFWLSLAWFSLSHEVEVAQLGLPAARRAVLLSPDEPGPRHALGYAYYLQGQRLLAQRFLRQAVATDPASAQSRYHLGLVNLEMGHLEEAAIHLRAAADLDPNGPVGQLADRARRHLR